VTVKSRKLSSTAAAEASLRVAPSPHDQAQAQFRAAYERQLGVLLMDGERAAGAGLWDHFSPLVRGLLARALGPGEGTEDALQEIFLRLYHKGRSLRDPARLRSFVVAIAVNHIRSELRKRRLRRAILAPLGAGHVPQEIPADTSPVNAPRLALAALYRALDAVPVGERLAFTLRFFEGLEIAEAAALSRTSLATFKRRLLAAKQKLRAAALADPWLSAYVDDGLDGELEAQGA
jgi:RNA polymerase sigma-70 factor (ECF subfamily)